MKKKSFTYKIDENFVQRDCIPVKDFDEQFDALSEDIRTNKYVPNDLCVLFKRMNSDEVLDFTKVYDCVCYSSLDIVDALNYVERYLGLYKFSKEKVISRDDMSFEIYCSSYNTFGVADARRTFRKYESATGNSNILSLIDFNGRDRTIGSAKEKVYR